MKAWDPDKVKYEDFLESLDDHQREALAEGEAHIASPKEGFAILKRYCDTLDSGEDGDEDTWKAYLQSFTEESDAKQALADIAMFFIVYAECGNDICDSGEDASSCPEDCLPPPIPASSAWGLVVLTLLVLSVGKAVSVKRRAAA